MEEKIIKAYLLNCPCRTNNTIEECFELAYPKHKRHKHNRNCFVWLWWWIYNLYQPQEPELCCKKIINEHIIQEIKRKEISENRIKVLKIKYQLMLSERDKKNKERENIKPPIQTMFARIPNDKKTVCNIIKTENGITKMVYNDGITIINPSKAEIDNALNKKI